MTRKDYKLIVNVLLPFRNKMGADWTLLVAEFANKLAADNPRFDAVKFMKACGFIEGKRP